MDFVYLSSGRRVAAEELCQDTVQLHQLRLKARSQGPQLWCGCRDFNDAAPLSIVVKTNGTPFFRRYPGQGGAHDPACSHYLNEHSGRATILERIEETEDGFKVRLATPLKRGVANDGVSTDNKVVAGTGGKSRPPLGLYGLFDFLWEQARFHHWFPSWAEWRHMGALGLVRKHAQDIYVGGRSLGDHMFAIIPDLHRQSFHQARYRLHQMLQRAITEQTSVLIIGEVSKKPVIAQAAPGKRIHIPLVGSNSYGIIPTIAADAAAPLFATWRGKQGKAIGLLQGLPVQVGKQDKYYFNVIDGCVRQVTSTLIPVDSDYEIMVADLLARDERAFEKPLRYSTKADSLPDFVLFDSDPPMQIMEVFGFKSPKYRARQAEKAAKYDDKYGPGGWWQWRANQGESMPRFPDKRHPK